MTSRYSSRLVFFLQAHFAHAADGRQRRAEFMRRIGSELAHAVERAFDAVEHSVEDGRQMRQFVVGGAQRQAFTQAVRGDAVSAAGHFIDGLQGALR